jgi:hypothetical protein
MIYAPVLITTLDRFSHFKQCLESLEKCTGADKTDVYVALDYPPTEEYRKGWSKIDEYLKFKEKNNHFSKLIIVRREYNYGLKYPNSNTSALIKSISDKTDRYILTEDDNIFAENFLEFINKGLEQFKDDPQVLAICGYRFYYPIKFLDNNFFRQGVDFNFWGCGCWIDKMNDAATYDYKKLSSKLLNPINVFKVWKTGSYRMYAFVSRTFKQRYNKHDNFFSVYMLLNNMHMIMPSKSKVRNIGWDGSGQNCVGYQKNIEELHLSQELDSESTFDFCGTGWEAYKDNRNIIIHEDYNKGSFWRTLFLLLYRYCSFLGLDYLVKRYKEKSR